MVPSHATTCLRFTQIRRITVDGKHHIALSVNDIAAVLQSMKERGLRLIDEEPKTGAEGKKIAFVHPKSVNGILLELSQE